jgi:bacteriocin-like protein
MKTAELTELTDSEMETVSGGLTQNGARKPKLGKLILFLLLLLLKKHGDSAPTPVRMQEV